MKNLKWINITLLLLLASCNRPFYNPPVIETPQKWRMEQTEGEARANLDWWQEFNDPVLTELIMSALQGNQEIRIAAARVLEFRATLGITEADFYPQINLEARAHRIESPRALQQSSAAQTNTVQTAARTTGVITPTVPRFFNDFFSAFRLHWELDFWGRIQSATAAAYDDLLSSISARQAVVVTIVKNVAQGYLNLRGLDAQLLLAQETYESRLETLELAKTRFNLGETSELEVKQEEAQVEIAAIRSLQLEKLIPQQENLVSILLGESPHSIKRGLVIQKMNRHFSIPAGIPSDLLHRRPDILQAEQELMAAQARISEARALFFPQISLTGLYGFESIQLKNFLSNQSMLWDVGVNMMQLIFDGWRVTSRVALTKARSCAAVANYRQVILQAFREVEDALVAIKKNRELVEEHRKQVNVLKDYFRLANLRYLEGEVDYLNALDAQRDLFNAQLASVQALTEELMGIVDLYSALGGGWVLEADEVSEGRLDNASCECEGDGQGGGQGELCTECIDER